MRDYESIFILSPALDETESEKVNLRMQEVIANNGGEVVKVEKWGKRKLAYSIGKHKKGEYVLVQFKGVPVTVAELERNFKMADAVIKYMTVRMEKDMLAHQQALLLAARTGAAAGEAAEAGETAAETGGQQEAKE